MKWLILFGTIAIISCASAAIYNNFAGVKLVRYDILDLSREYFSPSYELQVKEVNSTYNALAIDFTLLKDLPMDTKNFVNIYGGSSEDDDDYKLIKNLTMDLADLTSRYHKYLPRQLREDTKRTKILLKGQYSSDDYGIFKFYDILSRRDRKYPYYKVTLNIKVEDEDIAIVDIRFQSLEI